KTGKERVAQRRKPSVTAHQTRSLRWLGFETGFLRSLPHHRMRNCEFRCWASHEVANVSVRRGQDVQGRWMGVNREFGCGRARGGGFLRDRRKLLRPKNCAGIKRMRDFRLCSILAC